MPIDANYALNPQRLRPLAAGTATNGRSNVRKRVAFMVFTCTALWALIIFGVVKLFT